MYKPGYHCQFPLLFTCLALNKHMFVLNPLFALLLVYQSRVLTGFCKTFNWVGKLGYLLLPTAPQQIFTSRCNLTFKVHVSKETQFWKNHPFDHYGLLEVKKKSRPSLSLSSALWEVSPRNRRRLVSSQFKTDSHTEKTGTSPSMLSGNIKSQIY